MLPTAALTWFLSWPLTSAIQGHPLFTPFMLTTGISFAIVAYIGFKFTNSSNGKLVLGTLLGALAFYLITNSIAFFTGSFYPKTIDGYIQCMWTGSPMTGIPTWHFFRNSLVGNTLGTCLFLVAMNIPVIKQQTGFKLIVRVKWEDSFTSILARNL